MIKLRERLFRDEETAITTLVVACVSVSFLGFLQFLAAYFFLR